MVRAILSPTFSRCTTCTGNRFRSLPPRVSFRFKCRNVPRATFRIKCSQNYSHHLRPPDLYHLQLLDELIPKMPLLITVNQILRGLIPARFSGPSSSQNYTAAHKVLFQPELFFMIIEQAGDRGKVSYFERDGVAEDPSPDARQGVAYTLSRTCRAMREPATDIVWETLDTLCLLQRFITHHKRCKSAQQKVRLSRITVMHTMLIVTDLGIARSALSELEGQSSQALCQCERVRRRQ